MRAFMLGWEFPPFISGGLGTACYGLTKALSRYQVQVTFVLPKPVSGEYASHVRLLAPRAMQEGRRVAGEASEPRRLTVEARRGVGDFANVKFKSVPSGMISPYQSAGGKVQAGSVKGRQQAEVDRPISVLSSPAAVGGWGLPGGALYQGDLVKECNNYAKLCVALASGEKFDLVHAHDWLTFPAGLAVAAASGRPLVAHVHSTEFDRSGENINQQVYEIERRGMHGAMRVIAVSHLTKSIIQHRYGVRAEKIEVVYNGIETTRPVETRGQAKIRKSDKIVLFLGRITMQKGPEYFIRAAKKVLEKHDRVKFVMAGSGDKIQEVIEMAAAEGIGHKILFTGFLHGKDVERIFKMADLYVMPSVSEPFGIAPLEAISHDVPVIISKTSGVSEVLTHALKVDFWDIDEMANKIIAVLRHPPLSSTLREHADMEVRQLTWDDAAVKCLRVYHRATDVMPMAL